MTVYTTNFSEYSTGSVPSDWTERWDSSSEWKVQTGSGLGSKQLEFVQTADNDHACSWDDVGSVADIKILAKIQTPSSGGGAYWPGVVIRGAGTDGTDNDGYTLRIDCTFNRLKLDYYDNGSIGNVTYVTKTFSQGTWYWFRFEASGTSLKGKAWADGSSEPGSWDIDTTDSTITAAGWAGIDSRNDDGWCDYFSAGTSGDEPGNPLSTTTTTTTITTTSSTISTTSTTSSSTTSSSSSSTTSTTSSSSTTTTTEQDIGQKNTMIIICATC